MKFVRNTILLGILLSATTLFAQAPTMADAQKAYVAGNWKEAAAAYEQVCAAITDTTRTECYLWSILALSQTGSAEDFKRSGRRLDSLIRETNPQKSIYSDLLMTRAQFQMYLGKYDNAGKALVSAIETSGPQQRVALQKVCGAVQPRAKSAMVDSACAKLNANATPASTPTVSAPAQVPPSSSATAPITPAATKPDSTVPSPAVVPTSTASTATVPTSNESVATPPPTKATAPATNTQSTPAVAVTPQSGWALQLGAFGVKSNAELLVKNMKKRGITCQIEERAGTSKTLYIVSIPGFASKEAAVDYGAQKLAPIKVDFQPVKKK